MKRHLMILLLMAVILSGSNQLLAQWIQTNGPQGAGINCFANIGTNLFVGTDVGVYLSTDNGLTWTRVIDGLWTLKIHTLAVIGTELFAGTEGAGMFRSTNNGTTWSKVNGELSVPLNISSLAVIDTNLFAGAFHYSGGVFRSSDHGSSWIPAGLETDEIKSLVVIDTDLFALTNETGVYRSIDHGTNWIPVNNGLPINSIKLSPYFTLDAVDTTLYVGTNVGLYRSTDYGDSWVVLDTVLTNGWVYTVASIGTTLFVGTGSGIYSTHDGLSWTPVSTDLGPTCLFADGTNLFGGTIGGVFRSTDYGASWEEVNTGILGADIRSLVSNDKTLYAGAWSGVFRSRDNGNSWTPLAKGFACFSLVISSSSLYIGGVNHVGCSTDHGDSWEFVPVAAGFVNALAISSTYLFAGLRGEDSGVLRITHNAPGFWTITQTALKDTIVYALAIKDTNIYAGTEEGVFRSTNNGMDWIAVNDGLTNLDVRALAVNGSDLFAGTFGGGVFHSTDNGANWTAVNNGLTDLALNVLSFVFIGSNLFAGTWQGGVFLSTNNGGDWTAVNEGLMESMLDLSSVVHGLAIVGSDLYAGTRGAGVWKRPLFEMISSVKSAPTEYPLTFSMEQNYPNPFNPRTVIRYTLPVTCYADISVYNILGQKVTTLVSVRQSAGAYRVEWDASLFASGVYLYKLETENGYGQVKKLVLLK
jgi:photosystem II stability/assembly factor-like uncharacterized protein